jgi:Cryptococcal mannosyltransferase 1
MLFNCESILSAYWIPALLGLIDQLGRSRTFVSILENGSPDGTRELIMELQNMLNERGVPNSFQFEEPFRDGFTFQSDGLLTRLLGGEGTEETWIMTTNGWYPRRINYLAELRNMVMEPLYASSKQYDKVLFINDVIFSVLA